MRARGAAARPPRAAPQLLRALAQVGETDLREGLGPDRFAALSRLTEGGGPGRRPRRWRLAALLLGLLAAMALATVRTG